MRKYNFLICFLIPIFLLTTGCINVKYQQIDHYLLQVKNPKRVGNRQKIIKLDQVSINQQFASVHFIYRDTNIHYLTDYYNAFLIPPAIQTQQLIEQYLNQTHLFARVVSSNHFSKTDYLLQTKVLELYADYRNPTQPKAVMTIHFTVLKHNKVYLNKSFKEAILLKNKDTQSLVNGWNSALNMTLKQLVNTLQIITG